MGVQFRGKQVPIYIFQIPFLNSLNSEKYKQIMKNYII